jgi:hypothetical protein
MTKSKAYNLKIYCDLRNIEKETEEGQEFLHKKFNEQLKLINTLRLEQKNPEQEEEIKYSIIDIIRNRYV